MSKLKSMTPVTTLNIAAGISEPPGDPVTKYNLFCSQAFTFINYIYNEITMFLKLSLSFNLKIEGFSSFIIETETYSISPKDLKKVSEEN